MSREAELEDDAHDVELEDIVDARETVQERLDSERERVEQNGLQQGFIKDVTPSNDGGELVFNIETDGGDVRYTLHIISRDDAAVKSKKAQRFEEYFDADVERPDSFVGESVLVRYNGESPEYVVIPDNFGEALLSIGVAEVDRDGDVRVSRRLNLASALLGFPLAGLCLLLILSNMMTITYLLLGVMMVHVTLLFLPNRILQRRTTRGFI